MDSVRAMLDELMGKERNVPLAQRSNKRIRFDDPSVCKYQLAGLCPNRLFKNTRSDLGACQYELHDDHIDWESIQAEYDKQDSREKDIYERKLMKYLDDLIREMDRKIAKAKERANAESAPRDLRPEDQVRLSELQARAQAALERSQLAGEAGDVDTSMKLAQEAESLKGQHERLFKTLTQPERTMTVCDICGVFINSTDNDQRRQVSNQDHLTGKQYLGWKAIREKYQALKEKFEPGASGRSFSREPESAEPDRDRARSSERDKERERERSPRRDRERARSEYSRSDRGYDSRERGYDSKGYDSRSDRGYDRGGYERGGYDSRGRGYERGGYDRGGYDRGSGYERGYERGGYERGYERGAEVPPPDRYGSRDRRQGYEDYRRR